MGRLIGQPVNSYIKPDRIFDVHTHLHPEKLGAESLRKILNYHFLTTEVFSLGIPAEKLVDSVSDEDWMMTMIPNLPKIRNTSSFWMANRILRDLYGLDLSELKVSNWREFEERIREKYQKDDLWPWKIIKEYCGVERVLTSHEYPTNFKSPAGFDLFRRGCEKFNFGAGEDSNLLSLLKNKIEHYSPQTFRNWIRKEIDKAIKKNSLAFICWLGRFKYQEVSESALAQVLKKGGSSEITPKIASFQFRELLRYLREKKSQLPVQIIVGAHFIPRENRGARILDMVSSDVLYSYQKLFVQHPGVKIDILVSNTGCAREIDTFARMLPNVTVSGNWLHTMFPNQIKRIFSDRFEFLPLPKITAFFSDAYHAEWVYGKLALTKVCLEDVVKRKVEEGWWDENFASLVAEKIFWENPARLYSER